MAFLQRTKTPPLELARKRFPRPSPPELDEALKNSLSFLIVREPFERLLSAYRDKLEGYRKKYYKILGEQIVKKFRKIHTKKVSQKFRYRFVALFTIKLFEFFFLFFSEQFWTNLQGIYNVFIR